MTKCSECKYGEFFHGLNEENVMYYCHCFNEWIDEKTAELDELGCDGYEHDDRYDNFTSRSGKHRGSVLITVDA